eukprot:COSAG01_NODE_659_length_14436_cov_15.108112_14_plen_164_part_00
MPRVLLLAGFCPPFFIRACPHIASSLTRSIALGFLSMDVGTRADGRFFCSFGVDFATASFDVDFATALLAACLPVMPCKARIGPRLEENLEVAAEEFCWCGRIGGCLRIVRTWPHNGSTVPGVFTGGAFVLVCDFAPRGDRPPTARRVGWLVLPPPSTTRTEA